MNERLHDFLMYYLLPMVLGGICALELMFWLARRAWRKRDGRSPRR